MSEPSPTPSEEMIGVPVQVAAVDVIGLAAGLDLVAADARDLLCLVGMDQQFRYVAASQFARRAELARQAARCRDG